MANNCLVTKLKSVVDNDSLLRIGEYKMHYSLSSGVSGMKFLGGGTLTILGNNEYYFTQNGQQTKTASFGDAAIDFPAGEYDVLFTNKYGLVGFDRVMCSDLEIFKYNSYILYIGTGGGMYGDISFLKGKDVAMGLTMSGENYGVTGSLSAIASIFKNRSANIPRTSIVGNISILGNTYNNNISVVYCRYITGSLEGLVAALSSDPDNPFTSGTKSIHIAHSGVTVNGQVDLINDEDTKLVMTDPTHWYFPSDDNNKIDNPNYHVTIYAMNPTAAQISSWEANNNTVVQLS